MPQESWRYRSFVTCDDPKGVVECKTIRKSKTSSSKMEHEKNPRTSSAEKESTEQKFHNPSSFQLMEVSNGAKKLNRLIDLWSNGDSYNGQSKDLGNDLLKGAIDLQESLTMLGKLQEASQYMALLKKSQKSERKIDRARSDRFTNQRCQAEFQKPRHSADGDSRDRCDIEHRRVSRRSFAGSDFFSNKDDIFFHRRNVDLVSEMPSTSSNQSYSNTFGSIESSPSSSAPQEKANPPNLIARLMGLEEFPTKMLQSSTKKQTKTETIVNQKRPIFDIDKANIRKPQYLPLKEDQKKKTLREILETAQLKGLIKSNSFKESKYLSHCKDSSIENSRPIVLIKPIYAPLLDSDERLAPRFQKESTNEEPPLKLIEIGEVAFSDKSMHRETEAEEKFKFVKRPSQNKAANNRKELEKPEEKGPKFKANRSKVLVSKPVEKGNKSKPKSSERTKVSGSVNPQLQKKVAGEKKLDCNKKVQNSKFKNISIVQNQAKVTPAKPRKPETVSERSKNRTSPPRSTTTSPSNSRKPSTVTRKSSEQKKSSVKKEKPICEPVAAKHDGENSGKEDKMIEHVREVELVDKMIDICFEGGSVKQENEVPLKVDPSEVYFEENCNASESVVPNDISDLHSEKDTHHVIQSQSVKTSSITRSFLSNSPSFLTLADEYFDLIVHTPTTSRKTDLGLENEKLTMDYAKELMERRSLPDSSTVHSISLINRKLRISLDQLLDEVSAGLENLTSYSKSSNGGDLYGDSLYLMLERDLWGNAVVYGIWDMGWRKGFSVDLAEQVVIDIEKLIFSGLIEEIFA